MADTHYLLREVLLHLNINDVKALSQTSHSVLNAVRRVVEDEQGYWKARMEGWYSYYIPSSDQSVTWSLLAQVLDLTTSYELKGLVDSMVLVSWYYTDKELIQLLAYIQYALKQVLPTGPAVPELESLYDRPAIIIEIGQRFGNLYGFNSAQLNCFLSLLLLDHDYKSLHYFMEILIAPLVLVDNFDYNDTCLYLYCSAVDANNTIALAYLNTTYPLVDMQHVEELYCKAITLGKSHLLTDIPIQYENYAKILGVAINAKDIALVKHVFSLFEPDGPPIDGDSFGHAAIKTGSIELVDLIKCNCMEDNWLQFIITAIQTDNLDMVEHLVVKGEKLSAHEKNKVIKAGLRLCGHNTQLCMFLLTDKRLSHNCRGVDSLLIGLTNNSEIIASYLQLSTISKYDKVRAIAGITNTELAIEYYDKYVKQFKETELNCILSCSTVGLLRERVLKHPLVDPSNLLFGVDKPSEFIAIALEVPNLTEILLTKALDFAIKSKCKNIVTALIKDGRANPFASNITWCRHKLPPAEILDLILESPRHIPETLVADLLIYVHSNKNDISILQRLLADKRINITADNGRVLRHLSSEQQT